MERNGKLNAESIPREELRPGGFIANADPIIEKLKATAQQYRGQLLVISGGERPDGRREAQTDSVGDIYELAQMIAALMDTSPNLERIITKAVEINYLRGK